MRPVPPVAVGEFALIEEVRVATAARVGLPSGVLGIGDDCAVLPGRGDEVLLVSTDALVDGVHFRREWSSAPSIGWKSLAVNLSDVAAMGGRPSAVFLAWGLPPDLPPGWVQGFVQGFGDLAVRACVPLLGGDTTVSAQLFVVITVLGNAPRGQVRTRADARPGDTIWVTGRLGGAAAALMALSRGEAPDEAARVSLERPEPRLEAGWLLGADPATGAMIDLSDGLAGDLAHVCRASGVGARVRLPDVPVHPSAQAPSLQPRHLALAGGDDYELLFTRRAGAQAPLLPEGLEASPIGTIAAGEGITWLTRAGEEVRLDLRGYDHFAGSGSSRT